MLWTRTTAALVILCMLSACVSYEPVGLRTSADGDVRLTAPIKPGDRVRLVKKSGEVSEFRVLIVEETRISSENLTYELDDIQSIQVVRADNERAMLIVAIVVVTVGLGFLLINELEDDLDCAIGGC